MEQEELVHLYQGVEEYVRVRGVVSVNPMRLVV
jgi:hypothetical protein